MPDLQLISNGQCFPRYCYPKVVKVSPVQRLKNCFMGLDRITASYWIIFRTPRCVRFCQKHYHDNTITKDAIFDYVYGILHGPSYREDVRKRFVEGNTAYPIRSGFPRIRRSREVPLRSYISVTRHANSTHFPSCSLMTESHNRIIFD